MTEKLIKLIPKQESYTESVLIFLEEQIELIKKNGATDLVIAWVDKDKGIRRDFYGFHGAVLGLCPVLERYILDNLYDEQE